MAGPAACGISPFGVNGRAVVPADASRPALELSLSEGMSPYDIYSSQGIAIGRVYGHVLRQYSSPHFTITDGKITLRRAVEHIADFEARVLDNLHGLFILETFGSFPRRLYLDAGGCVPIVYCAQTKRVASSAGMMFDDHEYAERFARERHQRLIEREISGSWIVGRNTAHHGLLRLLPNFYLDLETWTNHRFWPRESDFSLTLSVEEAAESVADAMRAYVGAAVRQYNMVCPTLTAGYDSRLILAASRETFGAMQFVTMGRAGAGIDQDRAAELATRFGLNHRFLPIHESTGPEKARWDRCVGDVVSEINRGIWPTLRNVEGDLLFTGMYGETGRCRLYRYDARSINDKPVTSSFVLSRLTLPVDEELAPDIEAWVADLAWLPRSAVLDLAFNELRFGCWAMTQAPIQQAVKLTMMPFAQRSIQNAFMSVPPQDKGTDALFCRIVELLWPDLMGLRVNSYGDYRDYTAVLKKVLQKDHLVRFARDRFAGLIR